MFTDVDNKKNLPSTAAFIFKFHRQISLFDSLQAKLEGP